MKKILIVDDSDAARASLKFSLSTKGYKVIVAENGRDGIDKIESEEDIGIIITDLNMPVMGGKELIMAVRRHSKVCKTPILVLTSEDAQGQEAIDAGATGFLIKSSKTSEEIQRFVSTYIKL
jgi:CheY-like chemotaxis protein